jgi:hypothetical protein
MSRFPRSFTQHGGIALLLSTLMTGCGSAPEESLPDFVPVVGTVKQKGQPVAGVQVTFLPSAGPISSGMTDAEGKYELHNSSTLAGAVPGSHKVRLSKMSGEAGDELIPSRFNEKSTIACEVHAPGPNEFDFDI